MANTRATIVAASIAAKTLTDTSVSLYLDNPLSKRDEIPAGSTYAKLLWYVAGFDRRDSNISYVVIQYENRIAHHLADPTDENAYTDNTMIEDQMALMDRAFYEGIHQYVYEVFSAPELVTPERIGNVIEWAVTVQLSITLP